jgi:hypothetical protein
LVIVESRPLFVKNKKEKLKNLSRKLVINSSRNSRERMRFCGIHGISQGMRSD